MSGLSSGGRPRWRDAGHGWVGVLCLVLVAWRPLSFAFQLPATLPSLGMRGAAGVVELLFQGSVAAVSVAAARALWGGLPVGPPLAATALVASATAAIQSLYWSVLPHQTVPGDELPLAIGVAAHAAGWLIYLARSRRIDAMR
jgi:hypothetical protein